jgi:DNA-binding NtrC family response regulator
MLTGQATVESAIEAMKLGAYDYLTKPYRITELCVLVRKPPTNKSSKLTIRGFARRSSARIRICRKSSPNRADERSFAPRQRVAPSDTSVLITGESGTGKELIAQAVHRLSRRSDKTFIDLNCAALQDTLLESELFGHEAGAFSGARARKLGLFEIADSGTLFLDEVMEMPAQLQSKLLRALETRSFFRVGGVKKVEIDVRLVAATNRNAAQSTADGTFRTDLLYRINSFEIHIPPLRQRREDIEPLARYILNKIAGVNAPELTPQAVDALSSFSWTGNVRQLRNCWNGRFACRQRKNHDQGTAARSRLSRDEPNVSVSYNIPKENGTNSFQNATPTALHEVEKQQILRALEQTGWHRGKTAELLGISSSTLYRRLREYDLDTR